MRISTGQIYQRALNSMLNQTAQVSKWEEQLNTGKRVNIASDDPVASSRINLMRQRISAAEQLDKNRQNAQGLLSQEESMLTQSLAAVQKLRALQIQSANASLPEADRKSLGQEVQQLLDELQQLANAQDNEGNYLFSGSKVLTQAVARLPNGTYEYHGDETQRFQAVSKGSLLALNDNAKHIFMQIPGGNKDFSVDPVPLGNSGTASLSTGFVIDRTLYQPDQYSISFALNTANEMVVMVSGTLSGNLIPPSGMPDDAPLYKDGASLAFNGMEIAVSGQPAAGDSFSLSPAKNESIFSTAQRMLTNLEQLVGTSAQRAKTVTENNQLLMQLDNAIENLTGCLSQLGSRLNQLESAEKSNADLILNSQVLLQDLEGIDYAEVITKYNLQLMGLEAAYQSFMKIQGMSAFNYL